MRLGQGRSQRRDHVADLHGGQRHHVHEALDNQDGGVPADPVAGPAQAVQHLALVEYRALRRVQVLGRPLARLAQKPAAKGEDAPRHRLDREDDAVAEGVVGLASLLAPLQQTELEQHPFVQSVDRGRLAEGAPLVRRVPQSEAFPRLAADAASLEVGAGRLAALPLPEPLPEEGGGVLGRLVVGAPRIVAPASRADLAHVDSAARAHVLDGVDEAHPPVLHQEGEDVAGFARREIVEERLGGDHVEGGGLLLLEGAESPELPPRLPELDELADDPDDVRPGADLLDDVVRDHPTGSSPP